MPKNTILPFQNTVWEFYRTRGRHGLPWRPALDFGPHAPRTGLPLRADGSIDPYKVLVSEVMLQQTQVDRVIPFFNQFLRRFPTVRRLAEAPLADVLVAWQGLGYNRRAKLLHMCAQQVCLCHRGRIPRTEASLRALPGVGPYIAGAVRAFAYNEPSVFIETNIRTVFVHHFFNDRAQITDAEIMPLIEVSLDKARPREWYAALMDYGSFLKRSGVKLNARNPAYRAQSKFEGSDRQLRGAIIRALAQSSRTERMLVKIIGFDAARVRAQLARLSDEEMIAREGRKWRLA